MRSRYGTEGDLQWRRATLPLSMRFALVVFGALFLAIASAGQAAAEEPEDHFWVVSLGDSYTAGNGAGNYYGKSGCWRSYHSHPWRYAAALEERGGLNADIWHVACSSAVTYDITLQIGEIPTDVIRQADIVLLSLGGNDLNFSKLVEECFILNEFNDDDCDNRLDYASANLDTVIDRVRDRLAEIASSGVPDHAQIVLTGYPSLSSPYCAEPSIAKQNILRTIESQADSKAAAAVASLNQARLDGPTFHFSSARSQFAGRGPCASSSTRFVHGSRIHPFPTPQGIAETFHPNERGHQATADRLFQEDYHQLVIDYQPPPPDRDGDGVPDSEDACPDEPGPAPTGCPPPVDPTVSVVSQTVTESDRNQTVRVTFELSEPAEATTRVRYTTEDGTATSTDDYVRRSAVVTFPRGQTTKTANIVIRGGTVVEPTETFQVVLSQPTGLALGNNGTVTIEDNDVVVPVPTVSVVSRTVTETERNQTVRVTLELSEPASGTSRVRYTTADGTATSSDDYIRRSGLVTFARGQTTKTATVVVRGDTDHEPTETFGITLSQPTGLQLGANGTVTIEDNDPDVPLPVVNAVSQTVTETDRNQTIRVTIQLSEPAAATTRVRYTTVAGTATKNVDYTHRTGLITFSRGQTTKTATVVIRGGTTPEPTETLQIVLSQPTGLELGNNATITIQDND